MTKKQKTEQHRYTVTAEDGTVVIDEKATRVEHHRGGAYLEYPHLRDLPPGTYMIEPGGHEVTIL